MAQITVASDSLEMREVDPAVKVAGDFLAIARRKFSMASNATATLRQNQLDDLKFSAGGDYQWETDAITERDRDGRPRMTMNLMKQFLRQVTNTLRQANMRIKVLPVEDSDEKLAEVYQGIIRHIEDQSDAAVAYDTASNLQVTIGLGYIRVDAEYSDDRSFTQDLKIKRVRNQFMIYMDPAIDEVTAEDAWFCFVIEDVPKDEYETRFQGSALASATGFQSIGDTMAADWMPEGKIRIAEYWYVDIVKVKIHLAAVPDPETGIAEEFVVTDEMLALIPDAIRAQTKILKTRTVKERHVKMALINGAEILEGNDDKTAGSDWPGRWIPIVPVVGDEIDINGVVDYRGMVRDGKDPARLYNFEVTMLAETMQLAPMAQWVGWEGQFEGHEEKWNQANRHRFPYLEVKNVTLNGQQVPSLPNRINSEPAFVGINASIAQAHQDLQGTMGLYQESLGERANANQSGKAITALQKQGDLGNSNFQGNLARALRGVGRRLVDLIPKYYDAPRVMRIIGNDDQPMTVMVHANRQHDVPEELPKGVQGIYDLGSGKFDVVVDVGPSSPSKRAEAVEMLTGFIQAYPEAFPLIGHLVMKMMDFPGHEAAYEILKKAVPPQFQEPDPNGPAPVPPEVQQQMMQLQQQIQMLTEELQKVKPIAEGKMLEAQTRSTIADKEIAAKEQLERQEIASKERIEQLKAEVALATERMRVQSEQAALDRQAHLDRVAQMLDQRHDVVMASVSQAHEAGMSAADHAVGAEQADKQADRDEQARVEEAAAKEKAAPKA